MVCNFNHPLNKLLKDDTSCSQNDYIFANPEFSDFKFIQIVPINPQLAFINWQIDNITNQLRNYLNIYYNNSSPVLRIYDITDIQFDGSNARSFLDIDLDSFCGCHYFHVEQLACNLIAEIGLKSLDSRFFPLARSNSMNFYRPQEHTVFYNSHGFNRFYFHRETSDKSHSHHHLLNSTLSYHSKNYDCSTAIFLNEQIAGDIQIFDHNVSAFVHSLIGKFRDSEVNIKLISPASKLTYDLNALSVVDYAYKTSMHSLDTFYSIHNKTPFQCIQFHNWYSAPAAIRAASANHLPLISVFHSLELQRKSNLSISQSQLIESWERKSVFESDLVIVSTDHTRNIVIEHYGKSEDNVIVLSDSQRDEPSTKKNNCKVSLPPNLSSDAPILLFADELSINYGVDLIIDSLANVCCEFPSVQFVFTGEGELSSILKQKVYELNLGKNCFFTGHLDSELFDSIFNSSYVLLLPSRIKIVNDLVQKALQSGLLILTTHQTQISGITHGLNGLVVYDNPGSVCWGIKELLSRTKNSTPASSKISPINSIDYLSYKSIWLKLLSLRKEA